MNTYRYIQLSIICMFFCLTQLDAQIVPVQLGSDIIGEASGDQSGFSTSISSDGTRVIIGAKANQGNGFSSGQARIFQFNGASWAQLGSDIDGEAAGDEAGSSVAISGDGNTVIIGAPSNGGNGDKSGHARVFRLNVDKWEQLGADIDGEAIRDGSGAAVAISNNGSIVAIGAPNNNSGTGHVRVYQFNGSAWVQLGADIDGTTTSDKFGGAVSLSSNGLTVAIGAASNSSNRGLVEVYQFNGSAWIQLGADIAGEATGDTFGAAVSLSTSGTRLAVGAPFNSGGQSNAGHTRVFEYNGSAWNQLGSDIDGEAGGDGSGRSVAISDDGSRVAIGADGNNGGSGQVRVFEYDGSAWQQLGTDIDGAGFFDLSGFSVDISGDGTEVAIGAFGNSSNGFSSGATRIFELANLSALPVELTAFNGEIKGGDIQLFWETASESNNKGFEIQRSFSGKDWEILDFVYGQGNTSEANSYEYKDRSAPGGILYYRLKQLDFDGQFEYSSIISLNLGKSTPKVTIAPNPAYQEFQVLGTTEGQLSIWNNAGQLMFSQELTDSPVQISELPEGIYHVQLKLAGQVIVQKLVKK